MQPISTKSFFRFTILLSFICLSISSSFGQTLPQAAEDNITTYHLQAPSSNQFQMIYEVSATTPGAKYYYNSLRFGNEAEVNAAYDLMTGDSLQWQVVDGKHARRNGHPKASLSGKFIKVTLARPVPENGEARIRIIKTYTNKAAYFQKGNEVIFNRSLGIKRNVVVLPKGYELTSCNYPSQVTVNEAGHIVVSFMNMGSRSIPYKLSAKAISNTPKPYTASSENTASTKGSGRDKSKARLNYQPPIRTTQNREIVYFLQNPSSNSFRLYHDYTETREGTDKYLNVVRPGSKASKPSAVILDTGEELKVETLRGGAISAKGIELKQEITDETEVVVIWFEPVKKGQSVRLRIEETYTDPNRYLLNDGELIWDRSFGRNRNTVVLPKGWYLTTSSMPATIEETEDGKISLFFLNDRPDNLDVYIKAQKR
ncbi:MAG: hypothetical protein KTR30_07745 [Saprospiraceae bacterium]|nr:hypothetical protein [Saprospiraceae bacterium]